MNTSILTTTAAVLGFSLFAGQASAAVPVSNPKGLALDANGNLYVANPGRGGGDGLPSGQVLVYNPSYAQVRTIGAGKVSVPTGVAINSKGSVYVANAGNFTVNVFSPTGVQDTTKTLTNTQGIRSPAAIAIDGDDTVWVDNGGTDPAGNSEIAAYSSLSIPLRTYALPDYATTIAVSPHGPYLLAARQNAIASGISSEILTGKVGFRFGSPLVAEALAFDRTGKAYAAQFNGDVAVVNPVSGLATFLFHVNYGPSGLAVDSARKRVYVASDDFNQIDVFTTTGVYLTTLH